MEPLIVINAMFTMAVLLPMQTIKFGRLESIITGLFQPAMIIGILLFLIGIFVLFFPGARGFLGKLLNFGGGR